MKKIIIHIGSPKTGSTSIQSMLKSNKEFLESNGIYFYDSNRLNNDDFSLALANGNYDKIYKYIQNGVSSNCHTYILSSENLFWIGDGYYVNNQENYYLSRRESINIFKKVINEFFDSVEILLYIRPQSEFINSMYIQEVQFKYGKSSDEYMSELSFDYNDILNEWRSFFGDSSIHVKIFGEELFKVGLIEDFLNYIGIDNNSLLLKINKEKTNPTLTEELFLFKREFNKVFSRLSFRPNGIVYHIFGFIDIILAEDIANGRSTYVEINQDAAKNIYEKYKSSNEEIIYKYCNNSIDDLNSNKFNKLSSKKDMAIDVYFDYLKRLCEITDEVRHSDLISYINKTPKTRLNMNDFHILVDSYVSREYIVIHNGMFSLPKTAKENESEKFTSNVFFRLFRKFVG